MWDNLEVVKDSVMQDVPLCIIHPKNDDVVPPSHGQAIFEAASCKDKYGVWLCNASHNIFLTEEHLQLTRRFLSRVASAGRNRIRRRRLFDSGLAPSNASKAAAALKNGDLDIEADLEASEWRRVAG